MWIDPIGFWLLLWLLSDRLPVRRRQPARRARPPQPAQRVSWGSALLCGALLVLIPCVPFVLAWDPVTVFCVLLGFTLGLPLCLAVYVVVRLRERWQLAALAVPPRVARRRA